MTNNKSSMCAVLPKWLWWLATLIGVALLFFLTISTQQELIESDLKNRVMESLSGENISWASVDLTDRGRDVLLTGSAPSAEARDRAIEIAENVYGVRIVEHQIEVSTAGASEQLPSESSQVNPTTSTPVAKVPTPPVVTAQEAALKACQSKLDNEMMTHQILFAYDAAEIQSGSYALLDGIVDVLKECKAAVATRGLTISGHTDSKGDDAYNMRLSQQRADAVKTYILKSGVDSRILKSVGYGESKPVESNDTAAGRTQNRRIVFTIERN